MIGLDLGQMMVDSQLIKEKFAEQDKNIESILSKGQSLADIKKLPITDKEKLNLAMNWLEKMTNITAADLENAKKFHHAHFVKYWEAVERIDAEFIKTKQYEDRVLDAFFEWMNIKYLLMK